MPPTPHNIHPKTRLYVEDPLGEGQSVGLDHERAHFLRHVLRLDKGDMVAVFNGRDGEWLAAIDGFGKGWCSLSIVAQRREQRCDPDLWLLFAPIKRARIDSIAEKASELGVSRLWPVFTRRTDPARVNLERLRANAIEAAEQCERLTVPELSEPVQLGKALTDWPAERTLYLCAEAGAVRPIAEAVRERGPGPAAFLIGPEGGFDKSELDEFSKLHFVVPVGLGPRILRADTAVVAALACWQAIAGDWTAGTGEIRPPFRSPADQAV
jgi:16S rRNA (uracil1498-N3)-methyltransferase